MNTDITMVDLAIEAPALKKDMISIGRALLDAREAELVALCDRPMSPEVLAQITLCRAEADKLKRILAISPYLGQIKSVAEAFCALVEERSTVDMLLEARGLNPPEFRSLDGRLMLERLRDHFAPPKQRQPGSPGHPRFGQHLPDQGGHYAGAIGIDKQLFGIIVATKDGGESTGRILTGLKHLRHEAYSDHDGLANTEAMLKSGGKLARWARGLTLSGFSDWYLPARDELELLYRHFKPTDHTNTVTFRRCRGHESGQNFNCSPLNGGAYTRNDPAPIEDPEFRDDGREAFSVNEYYVSSTLHREAGRPWMQSFLHGQQAVDMDGVNLVARVVRRFLIKQFST